MVLTLTELLHHFQGKLYSCYDVERPKPFPDLYLYAAQQMNTNPENCLVIEDSATGVQAACAAGMTVFGYAQYSDGAAMAVRAPIFKPADSTSSPSYSENIASAVGLRNLF
jgi:phosphoglycolate phosphatase